MVTIWGRSNSSNVMKLLWLAEELALDYRRVDAGGAFGVTREPDYLAKNPNALVPTLEEADGWTLWESNAILRYLAATVPGGEALFPAAPRARAEADRWLDWQLGTLNAPMTTLFLNLIRTPEPARDMAAVGKARAEADRLWSILDRQLQGQAFVTGSFGLADIALGIYVHRWLALPVSRSDQPELGRWYERLLARPGYARHVALELT
jgi:glutathione S-transferase